MKSPSAIFMMLALCTAVTLRRLLSAAYLKAYSATLVLATRVMICSIQRLAAPADGGVPMLKYKQGLM